ncbi:Zn-ribbon domain-containing OB-fold protein [Sphingosinicella sp. LHD-64]|uniref:Zn-ribbon domain-containing OB-fold protein n=1 Tax=Sphingosinicella sp. LHD-64 TaxID=3072139 RepID=UPI00280CDFA0|nr:Zn-ribbon domain-containing OB-fold protein [Sphingosinicella sp. LHD-64]MDQ8757575.1 Zn-ribbon domain-containing OB-fold protein [Sphingosinicella sp. LHD-64]
MTAMTGIPLPQPTELSRPFWAAANEGRLVLQRCDACGHHRWTPQILCTNCLVEPFTWTEVSGRGKLYSYTIVYRAPLAGFEIPYVLAVVELEEGPLMLTRLVDAPTERLAVDAPVEVAFTRASEEINLYTFRLTDA